MNAKSTPREFFLQLRSPECSKWTSASSKFSFYRNEKVSGKIPTHKWGGMKTVWSWSSRRTWEDKQPPDAINVRLWIPKHQECAEDRWKDVNTWECIWHVHSLSVRLKLRFCLITNRERFRGILWVPDDRGWSWRVAALMWECYRPWARGRKPPEERKKWIKVLYSILSGSQNLNWEEVSGH